MNYTTRFCIAESTPCTNGDLRMSISLMSYISKQEKSLEMLNNDVCKVIISLMLVIMSLMLIILPIISSFKSPLWFLFIIPKDDKLSKHINERARDEAWRSTRLTKKDNIVMVQKTPMLDNMYRNTTLMGTWMFIILADLHTLEVVNQLLPPSLPFAQFIIMLNAVILKKTILTTVAAAIMGMLVWSSVIYNYIPTLLGIIDEESDARSKDIYRAEIRKSTFKKIEAWFDKTFDSILTIAVIAIVRAVMARLAYSVNYTSLQDYNIIAGLVALPFMLDVPIYIVTFVGSLITCGLSVAQYKTIKEYASKKNVLYFAISRDLDDKDQIYGKFGNHKVGAQNEKKRFAAYNTVNPSYKYMAVQYNKMIMGTKNQYLDNYINQTVLFKSSAKPLVNFKKSNGEGKGRCTDWFCFD